MLGYVLGITLVLTALFPLVSTDVFADSFVVNFDKQSYDVGDSLTVSGKVIEIGMPMIAMSIYDPDGKILSANNLEISPEKIFTKTLLLNSPFYDKIGEYLIKLDYGKVSENHYFVIENDSSNSEILIESLDPEIISLSTEQKQYVDKDVIKINGLVSILDSPSVLIGIYDPFGMPAGFYFGVVDSNLEFTTSFLVKDGVNFRVDGTYSIKAHYAESEIISFFEYSKDPQAILEVPVALDPVALDPVALDPVALDPVALLHLTLLHLTLLHLTLLHLTLLHLTLLHLTLLHLTLLHLTLLHLTLLHLTLLHLTLLHLTLLHLTLLHLTLLVKPKNKTISLWVM